MATTKQNSNTYWKKKTKPVSVPPDRVVWPCPPFDIENLREVRRIFDLPVMFTTNQLNSAWRKLGSRHHPDRSGHDEYMKLLGVAKCRLETFLVSGCWVKNPPTCKVEMPKTPESPAAASGAIPTPVVRDTTLSCDVRASPPGGHHRSPSVSTSSIPPPAAPQPSPGVGGGATAPKGPPQKPNVGGPVPTPVTGPARSYDKNQKVADEFKATVDAAFSVMKDMMGAVSDATQTTVDPEWRVLEGFRAHYDGPVANWFRSWGIGSEPKSLTEGEDAYVASKSVPYCPAFLQSSLKRVRDVPNRRVRWGMSQKVVQYVLLEVVSVNCVKETGECKCSVCQDVRLSSDLSMQLRRRDVKYAWYVRMETSGYGLFRKHPQIIQIPVVVAQEYMRKALSRPWSDAEFDLYWSEACGRLNVNATLFVGENLLTRVFCRDWWQAVHYRLDFHLGAK